MREKERKRKEEKKERKKERVADWIQHLIHDFPLEERERASKNTHFTFSLILSLSKFSLIFSHLFSPSSFSPPLPPRIVLHPPLNPLLLPHPLSPSISSLSLSLLQFFSLTFSLQVHTSVYFLCHHSCLKIFSSLSLSL